MTPEQIDQLDKETAARLEDVAAQFNVERAHERADEVLTDALKKFGLKRTVTAFHEMEKWYS
jgi:hypothetical protein